MIIRITNRCNTTPLPIRLECFNCKFNKPEVTTDIDLAMLTAFAQGKVPGITMPDNVVLMGGEPTAHPRFSSLVRMLLDSSPAQEVRIINGLPAGVAATLSAVQLDTSRVGCDIHRNDCRNRWVPGYSPDIPICDGDFAIQPNGDITICACPDALVVGNLKDGIHDDVYDLVRDLYDSQGIWCLNREKYCVQDVEKLLKEVANDC